MNKQLQILHSAPLNIYITIYMLLYSYVNLNFIEVNNEKLILSQLSI